MTGCNSNNGFYGHGNNSIYEKISRVSHLRDLIVNVRKELVRKMMKTFVIQAIYADNKSETPGEAWTIKWKTWKRNQSFECVLILAHLIIVNVLIIFYTFNFTPRYITIHHPLDPAGCLEMDVVAQLEKDHLLLLSDIDGFSSSSDSESDESECFSSGNMLLE